MPALANRLTTLAVTYSQRSPVNKQSPCPLWRTSARLIQGPSRHRRQTVRAQKPYGNRVGTMSNMTPGASGPQCRLISADRPSPAHCGE